MRSPTELCYNIIEENAHLRRRSPKKMKGSAAMSYAICRIQKCGSSHDIAGVQIHDRRERNHSNTNPDIDFERSKDNYNLCSRSDGKTFNAAVDEIIEREYTNHRVIRKDAVRMCEVLFTSDSEFFSNKSESEQRQFFSDCYQWAAARWGESRIVSANVHMDEKTPHMHLCFVPLTESISKKTGEVITTLNAHKAIGSGSKAFQQLQDDFYKAVGKSYGLERGIRTDLENGEQARKNQRIKEYKDTTQYYQQQQNALQTAVNALQATERELNDILLTEPQNAVNGISVPSAAKLLIGKENKDKLLYSPEEIKHMQELSKAIAVVNKKQEQQMVVLNQYKSDLKKREKLLTEKEQEVISLGNELEKEYKLVEQRLTELRLEAYVSNLEKKIKYQDEEILKYESKLLHFKEKLNELSQLQQKNQKLTERVMQLEKDLLEREQMLKKIKNKYIDNEKLYRATCDIGRYLGKKYNFDIDELISKYLEGYTISHVLGDDKGRNRSR